MEPLHYISETARTIWVWCQYLNEGNWKAGSINFSSRFSNTPNFNCQYFGKYWHVFYHPFDQSNIWHYITFERGDELCLISNFHRNRWYKSKFNSLIFFFSRLLNIENFIIFVANFLKYFYNVIFLFELLKNGACDCNLSNI